MEKVCEDQTVLAYIYKNRFPHYPADMWLKSTEVLPVPDSASAYVLACRLKTFKSLYGEGFDRVVSQGSA